MTDLDWPELLEQSGESVLLRGDADAETDATASLLEAALAADGAVLYMDLDGTQPGEDDELYHVECPTDASLSLVSTRLQSTLYYVRAKHDGPVHIVFRSVTTLLSRYQARTVIQFLNSTQSLIAAGDGIGVFTTGGRIPTEDAFDPVRKLFGDRVYDLEEA